MSVRLISEQYRLGCQTSVGDDRSVAATSRHVQYSVQVLVSDWLIIDGTMDNHVQSAIDGTVPDDIDDDSGESPSSDIQADLEISRLPRVARLGLSIRRAGWKQVSGWPDDVEGFKTWPTPGQMATMTLTGGQWNLVVFALRHWADVDEHIGDFAGAVRSRAIATSIRQRLVEQGWSPETP
jgi:hypothetical protein